MRLSGSVASAEGSESLNWMECGETQCSSNAAASKSHQDIRTDQSELPVLFLDELDQGEARNVESLADVGNLRTFPAPTSFFGDDFAPSDLSEGDDKWVRAVALPANAHQAGMFAEYPDCRSLDLLV